VNPVQKYLIAWRTFAVTLLLVFATSLAMTNGLAESWRMTAYAAGSSESVALRTISGTRTGLGHPAGMVVAGGSELQVSNKANNSVTVYARGAGGNVAPRRTISGARTGLIDPRDVALDSNGKMLET